MSHSGSDTSATFTQLDTRIWAAKALQDAQPSSVRGEWKAGYEAGQQDAWEEFMEIVEDLKAERDGHARA